jgi:hypothetical protein
MLHVSLPAICSPIQQIQNNITTATVTADAPSTNKLTSNTNPVTANNNKETAVYAVKEQPAAENTTDNTKEEVDTSYIQIDSRLRLAAVKLKENRSALAAYVKDNGFNTTHCFLVDMSIPSGKNRFFIYNMQEDMVECSALVSNGSGSYRPGYSERLVFSNVPNSKATSLGKYKIGDAYNGMWGLSYKLHGLDSTNDNAFKRFIVLHADKHIPTAEPNPYNPIYQTQGCPAVAPEFLAKLTRYINNSRKPVLLWIYD